jgi:putative oxidoreductase
MKKENQPLVSFVGRLFIALIFLGSGLSKLTGFDGTVLYIASKGLPYPVLGAILAAAVEIICALSIILGWRVRASAFLLAGYSVITALIFHNFWAAQGVEIIAQKVQFLKNISMTGGLLTLFVWGAGAWSFDEKNAKDKK